MMVDATPSLPADPVEAPEIEIEASRLPSLSPSRAADFKTCPLLFRFRTIDRLPEPALPDQARGTLVHAVLERLFDLPAGERTPQRASELVAPQWQRLLTERPELTELFPAERPEQPAEQPAETAATQPAEPMTPEQFLSSAEELLAGYFAVEDPRRLEPAEREAFEARALFQLKFYALVLWRTRGVVPRVLRLLYLKDAEICDFAPDAEDLARFERTLLALWQAIERATQTRDFRPRPSRLCGWCSHQARCPVFGGTPPPYPEPATAPGDESADTGPVLDADG